MRRRTAGSSRYEQIGDEVSFGGGLLKCEVLAGCNRCVTNCMYVRGNRGAPRVLKVVDR